MRTLRLISGLILLTLVIFAVSCGSSDGRVAAVGVTPPTFAATSKAVSLTAGSTTANVTLQSGTAQVTIPTGTKITSTAAIGDNITVELTDGSGSANAKTGAPTGFNAAGRCVVVVKSNGTPVPATFSNPLDVKLPVANGVTTGFLYGLFDGTNARILSGTWKQETSSVSISYGVASFKTNYAGIYTILAHQQGGN